MTESVGRGTGNGLQGEWRRALDGEFAKPYWGRLQEFVAEERRAHDVYPPEGDVYAALDLTPLSEVRVVLLGQDPYHNVGQAQGLCFSVRPGVTPPPSLVNIFRELREDVGCRVPDNGSLTPWARQGVLLLNAVLTVRAHAPNSHAGRGWESFTDSVLRAVNAKPDPVVFVLWGAYAQKKAALVDTARHTLVQSAHPSPLSARHGFFGSRPFSQVNAALQAGGRQDIDWCIPDL
jgi:uracil-DNA glycosylase